MSERPRIAVVLPEYGRTLHSQYAHYPRLLEEVARLADVTLVVEGGPAGDAVREPFPVIRQRHSQPVWRALELTRLLVRLRRQGVRHAFGSYSPYFGVVGGVVGRLIGIRTAYWHCRSDFGAGHKVGRMGIRKLLLDRLPMVLSLHASARVVTGSPGLADLYAQTFRLPRRKVVVVPNEVDLRGFAAAPRPDGGPLRVLAAMRLSDSKGADRLPAIARRILAEVPNAVVTIAGGGPDEDGLRGELADELAAGRVDMLGYVPNTRVRELMCQADLFLLPSLTEGFPRVLLEAMASGTPYVASDVGAVRDISPPAAYPNLVAPGDAAAVAARAVAVLTDAPARRHLEEAGRAHVQRFDVPRVAQELVRALTLPSADTTLPSAR